MLLLQGVPRGGRTVSVAVWLFNPFTATISSRGSGEALVTVMLLLILLLLFKGAAHSSCGKPGWGPWLAITAGGAFMLLR